MYSIFDYAYNGLLYLNNIIRPRHKVLSQLMIYSTTACQSRCKHCNIWQKRPVEHLSLDDIKQIMQSRCVTRKTTVGLEGGEFILHPQAEEIMAWFQANHPNYTLLSNCLTPHRVIDAVRRYHPRHLYVSLDGNRETYLKMRGCDGYDRVIEVVEALKDEVPLSLMFCLSPWNSFDDMAFVIDVAKQYSVDALISRACKKRLSNCPNCHKRSSPAKRRSSFTLIIKLLMKELARRHDESTVEGRIFTPSHAVFSKFNELYQ